MYMYSQTSFIRTGWYPLKCSDCESSGLLNHCKQKMIEEVTRKEVCSDCEAYGLKKHGLTSSDCTHSTIYVDLYIFAQGVKSTIM